MECWLPLAGVEGDGEYCVMGTEFQFCKMKKVLEMDGVDGSKERRAGNDYPTSRQVSACETLR